MLARKCFDLGLYSWCPYSMYVVSMRTNYGWELFRIICRTCIFLAFPKLQDSCLPVFVSRQVLQEARGSWKCAWRSLQWINTELEHPEKSCVIPWRYSKHFLSLEKVICAFVKSSLLPLCLLLLEVVSIQIDQVWQNCL